MSGHPDLTPELRELLAAMRDRTLAPAEVARLDALLAADPAARRAYVEYVDLCTTLAHHRGRAGVVARATTPTTVAGRRPRRWAWVGAGLAAGLFVAVGAWFAGRPAGPGPDAPPEVADAGVAVLTRSVAAVWGPSELPTAVGSVLRPGRLRLDSGLAQIEFYNGAVAVVEGPADLDVRGADEVHCRRGKLRVRVLTPGGGFRVTTPSSAVHDKGTEFGLTVDETHGDRVFVYDGAVEVRSPTGSDAGTLLTVGKGLSVGRDGAMEPAGRGTALVGTKELDALAAERQKVAARRWKDYCDELSRDPDVVLYLTFDEVLGWSRTVPNRAAGAAPGTDAAVIGCRPAEGRWPSRGAVDFKGPGDRVRVDVPGEFPSLTLAAWVRIDAFDRIFSAMFLTDDYPPYHPHWQFNNKGRLFLGVRQHSNNLSPPVLGDDLLGRWVHLAVVVDGEAGAVTHYLDGAAVSRSDCVLGRGLLVGAAEIGNWHPSEFKSVPHPVRSLNGRIDEFLMSRAAWSADRVRGHYEAGRPGS